MSSHEQPVYLETIDDVRIVEVSAPDNDRTLRHIACGGEHLPCSMSIFYPLSRGLDAQGNELEPYYAIDWDSNFTESMAVSAVRKVAENRQIDTFYSGAPYDSASRTWPEKVDTEFDAAIVPGCNSLGVYLENPNEVFECSAASASLIEQKFGRGAIISDRGLDDTILVEFVRTTAVPESTERILSLLETFSSIYKKYVQMPATGAVSEAE